MPPKRSKLSADNDSSEGDKFTKLYRKKLEKSHDLEPFVRSVVISLMFAFGDAEHPLQENADLVVNLLKNELILLLEDVQAMHGSEIKKINLFHILPALKVQTGILSRFVKYLENRVEMAAIVKSRTYGKCQENICGQEISSDDEKNDRPEDELDPIDGIGEFDGDEGEYLKKKRKKLGSVCAEEALLQEVRKMFADGNMDFNDYQEVSDSKYEKQLAALQSVIQNMSSSEYSNYSIARRASFQSHCTVISASVSGNSKKDTRKRKMSPPGNNRSTLLTWLGDPPIQNEASLVFVAFLAKEIVSVIVGSAVVERKKRDLLLSGPIRSCYYEEFLRKNKSFRKYGRLLL